MAATDVRFVVARNAKGGAELFIDVPAKSSLGVYAGATAFGTTTLVTKLGAKLTRIGPKFCQGCHSGWDFIGIGKINELVGGREVISDLRVSQKDFKQMIHG